MYYLDGSTWKEYGQDLPKAIVTNIFIDDLYNEIIVSTFGRGAWKALLEVCSDKVIYENTTLSGNQKVCGDLIVKAGKVLTLNRVNLVVQNIIIEPGAKIIWNGGSLNNSNNVGFGIGKGVCAIYNGSLFQLNSVVLNNYDVHARQQSTISINTVSLVGSSLSFHKDSFFHQLSSTTATMDINSRINLNQGFSFGYYSGLGLSNFFVTNYTDINMGGAGSVNGYRDNLTLSQIFNNGTYNFFANQNITTGSNVGGALSGFMAQNNVKMKLEAGESILLNIGTEIKNSDFLAQIDTKLAEIPVCNPSLPPPNNAIKELNKEEKTENQVVNTALTKTIDIFPNPSNGIFRYKLSNFEENAKYTISVYDLTGNLIKQFSNNKQEGKIDLLKHKAGTYAIVLEMNYKIEKILVYKK